MALKNDPFDSRAEFDTGHGKATIYRIRKLEEAGVAEIDRIPRSIRVLLEAALRQYDDFEISEKDIRNLAGWTPETAGTVEVPFKPARVARPLRVGLRPLRLTGLPQAAVDVLERRSAALFAHYPLTHLLAHPLPPRQCPEIPPAPAKAGAR